MRVLVVDQDSTLLTAITQLLGEYFTIDAVTTKADCLDLVRANDFDVIVAGERLEDGSGLELLGQMSRNKPDMLRIFAVDRERLKLLRGRLGPFGLFRTLSYPIEPRQLLAALSAAAGIEEEIDDSEATAEPVPPPPQTRSRPIPSRPPAPVQVAVRSVRPPVQSRQQPATVTRAMVQPSARRMTREVHDFTLVDEQPTPAPQPRRGSKARSSPRAASPATANRRRQLTPEALAVGSRLAAAPPPLMEPDAKRSAFLVGAGVVLVIGAMAIALHVFNTSDTPTFSTASLSAPATRDPPEVARLVADTEAAFQKQDYKLARTDITALQQIAPTHPRLPSFVALLAQHDAIELNSRSVVTRFLSRHASSPPKTDREVKSGHAGGTMPARARPGAPTPAVSTSFSGKTLEDSKDGAAGAGPRTPADSASATLAVTAEPRIMKRVAPEYPNDAAEKGIEGAVDLSFVVSPTGEVRDVTVVHSEPSSIFNRAAIAAVRHWKYQPKTVNGVAVEANVQLRMTFKLDGRS
jgi:TonB family protein